VLPTTPGAPGVSFSGWRTRADSIGVIWSRSPRYRVSSWPRNPKEACGDARARTPRHDRRPRCPLDGQEHLPRPANPPGVLAVAACSPMAAVYWPGAPLDHAACATKLTGRTIRSMVSGSCSGRPAAWTTR
jgi:hypothetical protein